MCKPQSSHISLISTVFVYGVYGSLTCIHCMSLLPNPLPSFSKKSSKFYDGTEVHTKCIYNLMLITLSPLPARDHAGTEGGLLLDAPIHPERLHRFREHICWPCDTIAGQGAGPICFLYNDRTMLWESPDPAAEWVIYYVQGSHHTLNYLVLFEFVTSA